MLKSLDSQRHIKLTAITSRVQVYSPSKPLRSEECLKSASSKLSDQTSYLEPRWKDHSDVASSNVIMNFVLYGVSRQLFVSMSVRLATQKKRLDWMAILEGGAFLYVCNTYQYHLPQLPQLRRQSCHRAGKHGCRRRWLHRILVS